MTKTTEIDVKTFWFIQEVVKTKDPIRTRERG
jgi:hypothetical protein